MSDGTEDQDPRHRGMDRWPATEIVRALWEGQMRALAACLSALPDVTEAVDAIADRLRGGSGRLVWVGAGSSGLVAALDALDVGDTFGWPEERLAIVMAGGLDLRGGIATEAEDDAAAGAAEIEALAVGPQDVVIGVSASGGSVFTSEAIAEARRRGALTIAVVAMAGSALAEAAALAIVAATGPEVLAGSTRLGAGTAQKVILNALSTAVMIRLGAVYDNLMVSVRPRNAKLRRRCVAIVARIAGVSPERATEALATRGHVKGAILHLAGAAADSIEARLAASGGDLRDALETLAAETRS